MTKMAACYPNYQLSISQGFTATASAISQQHQSQQQQHRQMPQALKKTQETPNQQEQSSYISSVAGASSAANITEATASVSNLIAVAKNYINTPKNYFVPLHVDCSVEYELPKQPKPPAGQRIEPLLMIHPCYFRKMESQRRSPFINNMPNSSRNGAAMFVGVALVSRGSNIAPASASTLSLKRTSLRNHQHHYNTRQNLSSHYGPISNTGQQQQLHTPQQHKLQNNLSLIPQTRYPEGNAKFLEHSSTPIRRTISIVNRTNHHHILCSNQQTNNQSDQQQDHLVQNSSSSSKSAAGQWEQLAAVKSSIADQNLNKTSSASINTLCGAAECSMAASATLGKRDAMISGSGGYTTNSASASNNISLRIQMNKNGTNNTSSSAGKNHNTTAAPNRSSYGISTCLVDKTKLPWNPKTNTTPSLFMIDQSPIATVPSNFQAGPDTTPTTTPLQNKYRTINDNNESINKNNIITSSEKFRHYLKSYRAHPYLTGTSSHSDSTALALSSKSAMVARGDFQVLPQYLSAKSAVAAASTATSFQQQMQQVSCYNV